jgi:hypothetical protein
MAEEFTLAVAGGVVLTEGIKFLYNQAAEVLKRWRERRDSASGAKHEKIPVTETPPPIFEGELAPLEIHLDMVEPLKDHLLKLRGSLANYADELEPVDPSNQQLLETIDALRQVMEAVFQQPLTFRGEKRSASGPVVEGTIDAEIIAGKAAAVEANLISSGRVVGTSTTKRVEEKGTLYGVKADKIGE